MRYTSTKFTMKVIMKISSVIRKYMKPKIQKLSEALEKAALATRLFIHKLVFRIGCGMYILVYLTFCGIQVYFRKKAARSAAQFSFFIIMTMFPLIICVNWMVSLLYGSYAELLDALSKVVSPSIVSFLSDYLDYISQNSGRAMLYAGLAMMIAPSAAAIRAMQGILCDIRNKGRKGSVLSFLVSFVLALILLAVIYACVLIMFTGGELLRLIVNRFGMQNSVLGWNWMRFLVLFVLLFVMQYITYRFAPFDVKQPKDIFSGKVYPGVIFSSVTMVAVSIVFSWFINLSTNYSLVYGSLAALVILMMWLYTSSNVVILGGIVNRMVNEYNRYRNKITPSRKVGAAFIRLRKAAKITRSRISGIRHGN